SWHRPAPIRRQAASVCATDRAPAPAPASRAGRAPSRFQSPRRPPLRSPKPAFRSPSWPPMLGSNWLPAHINGIAIIRTIDIRKYMSSTDPGWDLYRSFLAVLDEGSLSKAARNLGLTQPTLARHIEQLEAALGAALFTRSPRGLMATDAALALAPDARTMQSAAAALKRAASGAADVIEGTVRITASVVIGAEVLPGILRDLHAKHPKLS